MLKKRLLVLVVMLCLLVAAYVSPSASAEAYCSCAMECSGGQAMCGANCDGNSLSDIIAAAAACCRAAQRDTPLDCGVQ
jgi:hypothetical protein